MKVDNYKVYQSEINLNSSLKIKEKSIFLSNILVQDKVISYDDMVVLGDINCEYLLVNGNLVISGNLNVKEIDIEGTLICTASPDTKNIKVEGDIIITDKLDFNKKELQLENIDINNLSQYNDILDKTKNLKEKIIKEICENDSELFLEKIYNIFKLLGNTFDEFNYYNEFLSLLLKNYRNIYKNNTYLIYYLKVFDFKNELPDWLINLKPVYDILKNIEKIEIQEMIINEENKQELNDIKYLTYKYKNELSDKFNQINSIINLEMEESIQQKIERLYTKYLKKSSNYDLIECKIKTIEKNKIILEVEDCVEGVLTDYYDIGDKSYYKEGDKIFVSILNVSKYEDKIELDVYRNSKKCMYESINKLNYSNLDNIKKDNIEIINNEELCIINYAGTEKSENIEVLLKDNLLINSIKVLNVLDSKIKNISKLLEISEESITEDRLSQYSIKVYNTENYRKVNILSNKYKDLLGKLGIKFVSVTMHPIRTKYNIYTSKMNRLIEGLVIGKTNDEYIIDIEENVRGKLKKINSNKKYEIGDRVNCKIESVSLGDYCIYVQLNNIYDNYIKELIEYKIKELNIYDMIEKINIHVDSNKIYIIKVLLKQQHDMEKINTLKKEIYDRNDTNKVVFFISNNKQDVTLINSETINKTSNSSVLNKDINMNQITKMFNKKKKECGVPEIRILKNARINNYKTIILASKLTLLNDKSKLLSLEYDLESELNGERVKIALFSEDIKCIVSDILEVPVENIDFDKNKRNIQIKIENETSKKWNLNNEKTLLNSILPYYNIKFIQADDESAKDNDIINNSSEEKNVNNNILDLLFK